MGRLSVSAALGRRWGAALGWRCLRANTEIGFQRTAEGSGSVMLSALGGLPDAFPWWPQSHAFHQNQKGSVSEFWREVRAMVRGSYIHLPEIA